MIKNNNVKQMIRQQKLMAEERKEMVSYKSLIILISDLYRNPKRNDLCKEIDSLIQS